MAQIIVVASGKGGVGKSSVTAFLAKALVKQNKKVLCIDLDVMLKSLDLILSCSEKCVYDWADVVEKRTTAEKAVIKGESGNPDLLCAPVDFSPAITEKGLLPVIEPLRESYDFIFLDAPAGLGEMLMLSSRVADSAIVVATPDEVCVRSAFVAANMLKKYGMNGDTRLIINRFRKKAVKNGNLLNADSVIDKTSVRLIGIVPEDSSITFFSVTSSVSLPKKSGASLAFDRIAYRLLGGNIPLKFNNLK